jgi:erythromycin esterase
MAENLVWLLEHRYRGEKVIVWAASMHIARDVAAIDTQQEALNYAAYHTMGQGAWDVLKEQMYTIAFTAYDGVLGSPGNARALAPAVGTSLEGMFHATAVPLSFVDFRSLPADHWLRKTVISRPLGYTNMLARRSTGIRHRRCTCKKIATSRAKLRQQA